MESEPSFRAKSAKLNLTISTYSDNQNDEILQEETLNKSKSHSIPFIPTQSVIPDYEILWDSIMQLYLDVKIRSNEAVS